MREALVALALAGLVGACVSTPEGETPEWADAEGYPSLREVPAGGSSANTDARYWNGVEVDLLAARQQAQSNPRAHEPTTPDPDPQQFLDEARRELEETRSSHNPY